MKHQSCFSLGTKLKSYPSFWKSGSYSMARRLQEQVVSDLTAEDSVGAWWVVRRDGNINPSRLDTWNDILGI